QRQRMAPVRGDEDEHAARLQHPRQLRKIPPWLRQMFEQPARKGYVDGPAGQGQVRARRLCAGQGKAMLAQGGQVGVYADDLRQRMAELFHQPAAPAAEVENATMGLQVLADESGIAFGGGLPAGVLAAIQLT